MMFDFGAGAPRDLGCLPLASLNGSLLVDSGEEDATFAFRCQDRYVTYSSLAGMRSLLLVFDDGHADIYDARLDDVRRRLGLVADHTGVLGSVEVAAPLYVGYDPLTGHVRRVAHTDAAIGDPAQLRSLHAGILTNQISPSSASLFLGAADACAGAGVMVEWDIGRCRQQAALSLRFHDKASYVALLGGAHPGVAPHVATAVLGFEPVLAARSWPELCALAGFSDPPPELHVKSSLDSGGNVAAVVSPATLRPALAALDAEWRAGSLADEQVRKERVDANRRKIGSSWTLGPVGLDAELVAATVARQAEVRALHDVKALVQARVDTPAGAGPASIGCSFVIGAGGTITPTCTAQQVFVDAHRRRHLGSLLSERFERELSASADAPGFTALCEEFAAVGYRGPISFDAVLDAHGRYVGVFDCNPRLTAIFPAIAVRDALRAEGSRCDTILNLDYRGLYRWPDIESRLAALDEAGLLYTRDRQGGVLPLPNLANRDGFDVHLINLSWPELDAVLRDELLGEAADFDKGAIQELYS
jgi:hypothetical protein